MTVYRALNNTGKVKHKTESRIKKVIEELHEKKPFLSPPKAITMALHCSRKFFQESGNTNDNFYLAIVNNILRFSRENGIDVFQFDYSKLKDSDIKILRECSLLITCGPFSVENYKKAFAIRPDIKILSVLNKHYHDGVSVIRSNDSLGAIITARKMLSMGHRRVAVLGTTSAYDRMLRYSTFSGYMNHENAKVELFECPPEAPYEEKTAQFKKLIAIPEITAVFILCGGNAVVFKNYLDKKNIAVPEDIGLITYDNLKIYDMLGMNFSKIYYDFSDIALTTVKAAVNIFNNNIPTGTETLIPVKYEDGFSITDTNKMNAR
jgi:DNA-binding LacI/PurR family transcriptional regulator